MPRVFISLALVALTAVATGALTTDDFNAIDRLLFNPFCERQSVRSILKVCTPTLVVKDSSVFGDDAYSSASSGKVETGIIVGTWDAAFLVAAPSKPVKCVVSDASSLDDVKGTITFIPVSTGVEDILEDDADFTATANADEYETSNPVSDPKGVIIKISATKSTVCSW